MLSGVAACIAETDDFVPLIFVNVGCACDDSYHYMSRTLKSVFCNKGLLLFGCMSVIIKNWMVYRQKNDTRESKNGVLDSWEEDMETTGLLCAKVTQTLSH